MKQLLTAVLSLSLFFQPLFAQTPTPATPAKPAKEEVTEQISIEDLLPADTLAYVTTSNLVGLQHSFQLLDAYKVAQARLPKEELEAGDNPLRTVSRFLSFGVEDARALEGSRIGFALLLPELSEPTGAEKKAKAQDPEARSRMPEPLVLLFLEGSRMEDARKAREQLIAYYNDNFQPIGKLSEIKQTEYKGTKLDRFKNGEAGMWFGSTYVLTQPAALDRLLALRADRRAQRLADDQEFLRARTQMMPQTGLFAYLNGKPLNQLLSTVLGRGGNPLDFILGGTSSMLGSETIKSLALSSTFDREGVVDRLVVNLAAGQKDFLSAFFSGPKSEFKAPQLIPAGTEILVSHSLDWVKLYDDFFVKTFYGMMARQEVIQEGMQKYSAEEEAKRKDAEANNQKAVEPKWDEIDKHVATELTEEKLAKAIKEREARMDQELGFVLRDELAKDLSNEITVAYGIPKLMVAAVDGDGKKKDDTGWAVFFGIKDRAATQQALVKTFAYFTGGMMNGGNREDEPNAPAKTEEQQKQERELRNQNAQAAWAMMPTEVYKKVEIKSIFAGYLGFSDEFMIVADSKETIKQMLDLSEGGRALASDYNYSRAMNGVGSATTKVFIGPNMFDGLLNDFIKSWIMNPATMEEDASARAPLNVPATVAATLEADANSLRLEAFSPLGIAGTFALWSFGNDVRQGTERKETNARYKLRELAKAEKVYARKHLNRYATPETLSKIKSTSFSEDLKDEADNYKFEFKLKPGGKGYEVTANPVKYGRQGRLSFFMDESGKIHWADKQGAVATAADEEEQIHEGRVEAAAEAAAEDAKEVRIEPAPRPARRKR